MGILSLASSRIKSNGWRIRTNDELQVICWKPNIFNNKSSKDTGMSRSYGKSVWWKVKKVLMGETEEEKQ
jgi:hypothetical protein